MFSLVDDVQSSPPFGQPPGFGRTKSLSVSSLTGGSYRPKIRSLLIQEPPHLTSPRPHVISIVNALIAKPETKPCDLGGEAVRNQRWHQHLNHRHLFVVTDQCQLKVIKLHVNSLQLRRQSSVIFSVTKATHYPLRLCTPPYSDCGPFLLVY